MSSLEILSFIVMLLSVIFTIRENVLCWLFGIIGSILLSIIYFDKGLYFQILFQFILLVQCVIGYYNWSNIDSSDNVKVNKLDNESVFIQLFIVIIFGVAVNNYVLDSGGYFISCLDIVSTFIGMLATFLMINKVLQSWWLYMINNLLLVVLCYYESLYVVALLNIVLFLLSIKGYKEWKKNIKMV